MRINYNLEIKGGGSLIILPVVLFIDDEECGWYNGSEESLKSELNDAILLNIQFIEAADREKSVIARLPDAANFVFAFQTQPSKKISILKIGGENKMEITNTRLCSFQLIVWLFSKRAEGKLLTLLS